ncbi:hypothetical protein [Saccharothrix coeruleofusca]|uniref:hypothetical protein n=1 Tax=Saccharothrix coeruleofusca TaxID=33919 RepID=UPI00166F9702|nr:hypothetical protein [Saccharothrix coeruleofusca]MBP2339922.1 hypothetical protein [Saccharothrix coeruleofusca]
MFALVSKVASDCRRVIDRLLDEKNPRSTTDYTQPLTAWMRDLGLLMAHSGAELVAWADDTGPASTVVVPAPPEVPRLFAIVQDAAVVAWGLQFAESAHVVAGGHQLSTRSAETALRYFDDGETDPAVVWIKR